jgi:hypothetical protein
LESLCALCVVSPPARLWKPALSRAADSGQYYIAWHRWPTPAPEHGPHRLGGTCSRPSPHRPEPIGESQSTHLSRAVPGRRRPGRSDHCHFRPIGTTPLQSLSAPIGRGRARPKAATPTHLLPNRCRLMGKGAGGALFDSSVLCHIAADHLIISLATIV